MQDMYEYNNRQADIPQCKYLQITNEISDSKRLEIATKLASKINYTIELL